MDIGYPRGLLNHLHCGVLVSVGDIITDGAVEVLNPDHYIATMSSAGNSFKAELVVKMGKGYNPAKKELDPDQPEGTINIDAIFLISSGDA